MRALLALILCLSLTACSEDDPQLYEDMMPYDVTEPAATLDFTDGVTPIAAEMLNACVVDFSDQQDAIAEKAAPDAVCVSEFGQAAHGDVLVDEPIDDDTVGSLLDLSLESTGGRILATIHRSAGPGITHSTWARRDGAAIDLEEEGSGLSNANSNSPLATDGRYMYVRQPGPTFTVGARDAEDLSLAALVTYSMSYPVRAIAANGAHVIIASAEDGTPANNQIRAYPRAGGAALWTLTSPWTTAHATTQLAVAADGERAYILGDEDSTGAKVRVRAVDVASGTTLWTYTPTYEHADATWYQVRQRISSNGELVAILTSRRVIVLNAYDGSELWTRDFTDEVTGSFSPWYLGLSLAWGPYNRLYVGRAFVASSEGTWAFEGVTGRVLWRNDALEPLALAQDGGGLFAIYDAGTELDLARIQCESGPMLMTRAEPTDRYRRPWAKLLIPAAGQR